MFRSIPRWTALLLLLVVAGGCSLGTVLATKIGEEALKILIEELSKSNAPLPAGQTMTGRLETTDPQLSDGSHYDTWNYSGRRGERIQITMRSDDFDTYLLLANDGTPPEVIVEDDDSGGELDSQITFELPADGTYIVVANSFSGGATGEYTIRLESLGASPAPNPTPTVQPATQDWAQRYPGGGDPNERYALLVGIDDYRGIGNSLNGPVADARLIGRILVDTYGFRPENVVVITDREATRDHISQAFLRHLGQAGPQGAAVFYYSGHGMQMDENVALTGALDPEPDDVDEALYIWGSGGRSGILLDDELGFLADRLQTERVLFIIDSCYSGTGTRGGAGGQSKEVKIADVSHVLERPTSYLTDGSAATAPPRARGMSDLMREPQRHLLLAASSDQQLSWTASGWPKYGGTISVFTYYLAEALENASRTTTFGNLMSSVSDRTDSYTQSRYNARQTPQAEGRQSDARVHEFLSRR